uniref:Uncharacterized protein n=1 Tax=Rhizophora mucronata TaxID=61149 RepID=A0A2P2KP59_RHIMU
MLKNIQHMIKSCFHIIWGIVREVRLYPCMQLQSYIVKPNHFAKFHSCILPCYILSLDQIKRGHSLSFKLSMSLQILDIILSTYDD